MAASASKAWAGFMTVTRLDGVLGLGGGSAFGVAAGGLSGLSKTLRLEWPNVACRAVDIDPDIDTEEAVDVIVSELCDPDRSIVEVGYDGEGRVTPEAAWMPAASRVGEV
mgnify:CR=1 FL=1